MANKIIIKSFPQSDMEEIHIDLYMHDLKVEDIIEMPNIRWPPSWVKFVKGSPWSVLQGKTLFVMERVWRDSSGTAELCYLAQIVE
jgi:hypothetical protein